MSADCSFAEDLRSGYPVRLTKEEARLLMKLMTMQVDYPELEPEHQELYEKLERVL